VTVKEEVEIRVLAWDAARLLGRFVDLVEAATTTQGKIDHIKAGELTWHARALISKWQRQRAAETNSSKPQL